MAKGSKPKAGSRAFWPRKRAKRIYPKVKAVPKVSGDVKPLNFAAYKAGMTTLMHEGNRKDAPTFGREMARAVTVLDCPPLMICGAKIYGIKNEKLSSLGMVWAEKLDKTLSRKVKVPKKYDFKKNLASVEKLLSEAKDVRLMVSTQPTKSGAGKKRPEIFEVHLSGDTEAKWNYAKENLGKEIKVETIFEEGEFVDTSSVTIGKGTQGPVKRFGVTIRSRKNQGKRRHIGNIGSVGMGRVLPGKIAMAGQHGFQTRTEYNKRIFKIGTDGFQPKGGILRYGSVPGQYVMIHGSVGGPKKRLIMLRKSMRKTGEKHPVEIKHISKKSQQ